MRPKYTEKYIYGYLEMFKMSNVQLPLLVFGPGDRQGVTFLFNGQG